MKRRERPRINWPEIMGDLHAYGGAALAAWGFSMLHPGYGWICFGAFMAWLGLRR